jgi:hypothetical protein
MTTWSSTETEITSAMMWVCAITMIILEEAKTRRHRPGCIRQCSEDRPETPRIPSRPPPPPRHHLNHFLAHDSQSHQGQLLRPNNQQLSRRAPSPSFPQKRPKKQQRIPTPPHDPKRSIDSTFFMRHERHDKTATKSDKAD